uniref:Uncharacterized protein n=1 Tax=Glypta fumiferanae TaxID=389681 RepID=A0A0F6Q8S2_9HYME|nr:hypothetical protein [Glypta fumiferanae]
MVIKMNWILMNITSHALRSVSVKNCDKRGNNVDGNCFIIEIKDPEERKKFVKCCNDVIPSLNINYDDIAKLSNVENIFKFRLLETNERINLLNDFADKLSHQIYDALVSRPVYTFVTHTPNGIVDAFERVATETRLITLEDVIRVVTNKNDYHLNKQQTFSELFQRFLSFA